MTIRKEQLMKAYTKSQLIDMIFELEKEPDFYAIGECCHDGYYEWDNDNEFKTKPQLLEHINNVIQNGDWTEDHDVLYIYKKEITMTVEIQ